jgi:hypothetical protein
MDTLVGESARGGAYRLRPPLEAGETEFPEQAQVPVLSKHAGCAAVEHLCNVEPGTRTPN